MKLTSGWRISHNAWHVSYTIKRAVASPIRNRNDTVCTLSPLDMILKKKNYKNNFVMLKNELTLESMLISRLAISEVDALAGDIIYDAPTSTIRRIQTSSFESVLYKNRRRRMNFREDAVRKNRRPLWIDSSDAHKNDDYAFDAADGRFFFAAERNRFPRPIIEFLRPNRCRPL